MRLEAPGKLVASGLLSLSIGCYTASLLAQQTYCSDHGCDVPGWYVLILGAIGFPFSHVYAIWLANPILLAAWIGIWTGKRKAAICISIVSLMIAASFMLVKTVVGPWTTSTITGLRVGYWLWLASMAAAFAAALFADDLRKPRPAPDARNPLGLRIGRRLVAASVTGSVGALALRSVHMLVGPRQNVIDNDLSLPVSFRRIAYVSFHPQRARGGNTVQSMAWSPDGRYLATAYDSGFQVRVLDTTTWTEISRFNTGWTHGYGHQYLAFLSNDEIVTLPKDNTWALAVHDRSTGQLIRGIVRPTGFGEAQTDGFVVTSSRNYVAVLGHYREPPRVLLFDSRSGRFVSRLATPADSSITALAGGPSDKLAVGVTFQFERAHDSVRKEIYILDAATNTVERILSGHVPGVTSIAWSPDGKLIASGSGPFSGGPTRDPDPIRIWDAATGAMIASFVGDYAPVSHLAWHPSSAVLATLSAKGNGETGWAMRLFSIPGKTMIFEYMPEYGERIEELSFQPSTGHLVWSRGDALHVYEVLGLS